MRTMKNIILVILFLVPAILRAEGIAYYIRITDFDGATGYTEIYEVKSQDNANGVRKYIPHTKPATVVFEGKSDIEKINALGEFLTSIDYSILKKSYTNPNVFDGYQVFYEIIINQDKPKKFSISNCYHMSFIEISKRVNELLPEEHRMKIPSGNESFIKRIKISTEQSD